MNKINQAVKRGDLIVYGDLFASYSAKRLRLILKRARDHMVYKSDRQRVRIPF